MLDISGVLDVRYTGYHWGLFISPEREEHYGCRRVVEPDILNIVAIIHNIHGLAQNKVLLAHVVFFLVVIQEIAKRASLDYDVAGIFGGFLAWGLTSSLSHHGH